MAKLPQKTGRSVEKVKMELRKKESTPVSLNDNLDRTKFNSPFSQNVVSFLFRLQNFFSMNCQIPDKAWDLKMCMLAFYTEKSEHETDPAISDYYDHHYCNLWPKSLVLHPNPLVSWHSLWPNLNRWKRFWPQKRAIEPDTIGVVCWVASLGSHIDMTCPLSTFQRLSGPYNWWGPFSPQNSLVKRTLFVHFLWVVCRLWELHFRIWMQEFLEIANSIKLLC